MHIWVIFKSYLKHIFKITFFYSSFYVVLTLNFLLTLTLNTSTILVINGLDTTITANDIIQCLKCISDKLNIYLPIGVKNASTIIPNIA